MSQVTFLRENDFVSLFASMTYELINIMLSFVGFQHSSQNRYSNLHVKGILVIHLKSLALLSHVTQSEGKCILAFMPVEREIRMEALQTVLRIL